VECENNWTLDNLCFFGTYRVFGKYDYNSEAFFVVWIVMVVYAVLISLYLKDLYAFTREYIDIYNIVTMIVRYTSEGAGLHGLSLKSRGNTYV
jgi:hypothetical protein